MSAEKTFQTFTNTAAQTTIFYKDNIYSCHTHVCDLYLSAKVPGNVIVAVSLLITRVALVTGAGRV